MSEILFRQHLFNGLNMFVDPSKRQEGEYIKLKNGRARFNKVVPVNKPVVLNDSNISGIKRAQTIITVGYSLILIADGNVYIKDLSIRNEIGEFTSPFRRLNSIDNSKLSSDVDVVWAVKVPASTINYTRKIVDDGSVIYDTFSSPSPLCVLCQDGINQPIIITPDGVVRRANNYGKWSVDDREYVPIGMDMCFSNGILYIVSPDRKRVYRSVSGRPLDFMVVIDKYGNKLSDEQAGGAEAVSFQVDVDDITALKQINNQMNGFYLSTKRSSYMIVPDYQNTLFGEPVFNFVKLFDVGAINSDSVIEILGDVVFISENSISSFNAVANSRFQGQNTIFSKNISTLIKGVKQDSKIACAEYYDDYVLFNMQTTEGNCIIVYDMLTNTYAAYDKLDVDGNIKKMVYNPYVNKVFYLTDNNEVGILYESKVKELCELIVGDFITGDGRVNIKPDYARLFINGDVGGIFKYKCIVDAFNGATVTKRLAYINPRLSPVSVLDLHESISGWKCRLVLEWNSDIEVTGVEIACDSLTEKVTQTGRVMASKYIERSDVKCSIINNGETFEKMQTVDINGENITDVDSIYLNNIKNDILSLDNNNIRFVISNDCSSGWNDVYIIFSDGSFITCGRIMIK